MFVALLRLFVDITLWRRGPQDLPASPTLATLVLIIFVLADVVQVSVNGWAWPAAFWVIVFDVGLQALWLWGLLWYVGKRPRFLQTFTAFLGVGALLALVGVVVDALLKMIGMAASSPSPWQLLQFGMLLMALGRILQVAMERSLFMGMTLTWVIMLTIAAAMKVVLPSI